MRSLAELVSLACRLFLAGLFLWAAHDKVWDPATFAAAVARYDLIPLWLVNPGSVLMAWLELVLAVCLLLGLATRAAALGATGLMVFFTGLMIYAGLTGAGFDCGCFPGQAEHPAGYEAAVRDALMALPALWLLAWPGRWLSLGGSPRSRRQRLEYKL
ncbi:MAG: DoxX family membrane protein [Desulfarculaceae bacterium]|nr:DoxX family membrane protein [Desulfarculaceae bacterium]MCF8072719.1 DoxX family membrane protein [Desulfarculaceae bacterium]MCF8102598.1 DoxX family membrane protein [Desulfarculaceae bacterium]MCF8116507.1 DoxX family membrane protein [Desulfarculaceae bacterium]